MTHDYTCVPSVCLFWHLLKGWFSIFHLLYLAAALTEDRRAALGSQVSLVICSLQIVGYQFTFLFRTSVLICFLSVFLVNVSFRCHDYRACFLWYSDMLGLSYLSLACPASEVSRCIHIFPYVWRLSRLQF